MAEQVKVTVTKPEKQELERRSKKEQQTLSNLVRTTILPPLKPGAPKKEKQNASKRKTER